MPEEASPYFPAGTLRARLRFSPSLRELLISLITRVHTAQAASPESPHFPPGIPDPDLQAAWVEGLREREEYDTAALLELLSDTRFGILDLPLTPSAAEAVARASVHVRLYLRETVLRNLNTEQVEGVVDIYGLPPAEQQAYACYRLMVHLEEDLLIQLDPGLLGH